MTVYSVYEPADAADLEARSGKVAFVKDGIAWLALLVPILWLIYHRMWLELVAFLVIFMALPLIFGSGPAGREIAGWASLGLTVLFALEANDLRGWALRRKGFKFAGTAWGRDRIEAETQFFSRWLPEQEKPSAPIPAVVPTPQSNTRILPTRLSGGDEVIGSFPRS